jgi:hypothetical protein
MFAAVDAHMKEDAVSYLSKLTVAQLKKPQSLSPTEQRRAKLVVKLEEQLALAQAQAEGRRFVVTKPSWTRDDAGNKQRVQRERTVKPWWWQDGEGLCLVARYGARILEISKGKRAIMVNTPAMLPGALNTLIAATKAGELDGAIEQVLADAKTKAKRI